MIRINKGNPPVELIADSLTLTNQLKTEFDNFSQDYLSGQRKFTITELYKSTPVKNALKNCQHNKCCFSEAKFNGDYFHVEHFRPKKRIDDWSTKAMQFPGYYWLAYEWSNLFLCKSRINSTYKKNFFPLADESTRNWNHNDTNIESNLLIDPSVEDPRIDIKFYNDEPIGVTLRGDFNITFLGLKDDTDLVEGRRTKLELLKALKNATDLLVNKGIDKNNPVLKGCIEQLKYSITPEAEFSSMAIDFLSVSPLLQ